jgi:glucose/arabinose dehydrogenase
MQRHRSPSPIRRTAAFCLVAALAAARPGIAADTDADGIDDQQDNCSMVANPDQLDTNADDYGNACDPDFDGNLVVDFTDLGTMKQRFFTTDADTDLTGDGSVNFDDLATLKEMMFEPPGPSGVATVNVRIAVPRVFPRLSFELPVRLMLAPGDASRWYVVEQEGYVRSFANVADPASSDLVLDIHERVECCGEAGLLGLAFHPDYPEKPLVYVSYTREGPSFRIPLISYISEFRTNDGGLTIDPSSERPLLKLPQPYENHNGGHIAFGPDGYLYIGFGDGGSGGDPQDHAQDVNDLLGSILRIDVNVTPPARYAIPPSNPFAGNAECRDTSGCPELYAWGLRNPWAWSFDTATGRLWLGDVGQNEWEEVDVIEKGGNYGWRCYEGDVVFNPDGCGPVGNYIFPIAVYSHSLGIAVTGGYVYHGTRVPALRNVYLYGDYGSGRIWGIDQNLDPLPRVLLDSPHSISSFGQDLAGEVYLLDYDGGGIYRIDRGT